MEYATIFIGVDKSICDEPVIKAEGVLLGTVEQIKEYISKFERDRVLARIQEALECGQANFERRVIAVIQDAKARRVI